MHLPSDDCTWSQTTAQAARECKSPQITANHGIAPQESARIRNNPTVCKGELSFARPPAHRRRRQLPSGHRIWQFGTGESSFSRTPAPPHPRNRRIHTSRITISKFYIFISPFSMLADTPAHPAPPHHRWMLRNTRWTYQRRRNATKKSPGHQLRVPSLRRHRSAGKKTRFEQRASSSISFRLPQKSS